MSKLALSKQSPHPSCYAFNSFHCSVSLVVVPAAVGFHRQTASSAAHCFLCTQFLSLLLHEYVWIVMATSPHLEEFCLSLSEVEGPRTEVCLVSLVLCACRISYSSFTSKARSWSCIGWCVHACRHASRVPTRPWGTLLTCRLRLFQMRVIFFNYLFLL